MVLEVNDVGLLNQMGNVLVDFYTAPCAPCRIVHSILEEISNEYENLKIAKVDVTRNSVIPRMYGVTSVPTIILMQDCKVKEILRGYKSKALIVQAINKHFNGYAKKRT